MERNVIHANNLGKMHRLYHYINYLNLLIVTLFVILLNNLVIDIPIYKANAFYFSNINICCQNKNEKLFVCKYFGAGLTLYRYPDDVLTRTYPGTQINSQTIHQKIQKYLSDQTVLCRGFVKPDSLSSQEHRDVFPSAKFSSDRIRHVHCEGIVQSGSKTKNMCKSCLNVQYDMLRHLSNEETKDPESLPSKYLSFSRLTSSQKTKLYNITKKELSDLQKQYKSIKPILEKYDRIFVRDDETNAFIKDLYIYIDKNFDKLNDALKSKPLLCEFLQDQLKSAMQDNKV